LKSCVDCQRATFSTLQARLLYLLSSRINNGEFTERGLARLIGVSQPQFHNVLKGKRKLQTKLADRILQKFDISVLDLFHETELREQLIGRSSTQLRGSWEVITCSKRSGTNSESCPRKPSGREAVRHPPARDLAS
jgi:transcriptional regulator with XRE-family HTH domain